MKNITREKDLNPSNILHHIIDSQNDLNCSSKEYTYFILGEIGPTGKTWLTKALRDYGFNAVELSGFIYDLVNYNDDENHFMINEYDKTVMIVLNRKIFAK